MTSSSAAAAVASASAPLLDVRDLTMHFPIGSGWFGKSQRRVHAVDGLSFTVDRGETVALVGESGCGKSTVGRCLVRLLQPTSGQIRFDGVGIESLPEARMRGMRRRVGLVFQDPFSSLNPRMRVRELIAEPIRNFEPGLSASAREARLHELLDTVRLPRTALDRWPHEFSGGQRQRIGIARALAGRPDLLICDEAVSALDVSVKAQIVNLLRELQRSLGLAVLFISHDLAIVEQMTHRVAVMYLGKIVEIAPRRAAFAAPFHPYTVSLLSAVPVPVPGGRGERIVLRGDVPSPINPPSGCRFHTRCPHAFERCRSEEPLLREVGDGHLAACHLERRIPIQAVPGAS